MLKWLSDRSKVWIQDRHLMIVVASSMLFSVFFSVIAILRYEAFSFGDYDSAIFIHEAWKILHGSSTISLLDGASIWGNAIEVISFITAPYFALSGLNPKSLFVLQAVLSGFGAVPLFLLARRQLPSLAAVCIAVSYLFYPPLWYSNLYEYNPLSLVNFTFLMTFYFFETGRFRWFVTFLILCMLNRLDVSIVTVMFAPYALWRRRPWKWVLVPAILSVGWIAFGIFVLIPKFRHFFGYFELYYPQFGKTFSEIVVNIVTHPGVLWDSLATKINAIFLFRILFPVVFLPLGGLAEFLICSLSLTQHLISSRQTEHTIFFHYTATITPFVYVSAVSAIAKFRRYVVWQKGLALMTVIFCLIANFVFGPLHERDKFYLKVLKTQEDVYKKELLSQISPESVVVSSFEFSPMLAGRMLFYSFHYIYRGLYHTNVPYPVPENVDTALINFSDPLVQQFRNKNSDLNAQRFLQINQLGIVDMFNNTVLFKRGHRSSLKLYDVKESSDNERLLTINKQIALKTFEERTLRKGPYDFLEFVFHWMPLTEVKQDIWMDIAVVDQDNRIIHQDLRPLCYGVYPPQRWKVDQDVLDYYRLLLPFSLSSGTYKVSIAFFSPFTETVGFLPITVNGTVVYRKTLMKLFVPPLESDRKRHAS